MERNEAILDQSSLVSLRDEDTNKSHARYSVLVTQHLTIKARLVHGDNFEISPTNKVGNIVESPATVV